MTWRWSSLPNTTDSMRARQTRSVIASTRTTLFSVFMRLEKLLPVPIREVCQLPTISTQVSTDSKLKRPQRRAAAWKQNAATKARIAELPASEKRFSCQARAGVEVAHEEQRLHDRGEHRAACAYRSSTQQGAVAPAGERRGQRRRLGAGDRQRLVLLEQLAGEASRAGVAALVTGSIRA